MRKVVITIVCAIACIGLANRALAEEIPDNTLAQMGLAGMQHMSDEQGTQVRGEGIALIFGAGGSAVVLPGFSADVSGHFGLSTVANALANGDSSSTAQSSLSLQLNIIGLTGTLSLINNAVNAGNSYSFAR